MSHGNSKVEKNELIELYHQVYKREYQKGIVGAGKELLVKSPFDKYLKSTKSEMK